MTYTKIIAATLTAASLAGTTYAQDSGAYGAIGATTYEFDNHGIDAKLGYNFNKHFGVEAQGVWGLTTDSSPVSTAANAATVKSKVDYTLGAFAVVRAPLSEQFEIFARGGVHNTQTHIKISNALGTDFDVDKTGLAAGGGVQYNLNNQSALRADYTYLDDSDLNMFSVGYVRKF